MNAMEKLVELQLQADIADNVSENTTQHREFTADFMMANGVTVLPCKIGDEFWTDWVGITKVKCSMLTQKADGSWKGRFSIDNGWGSSVNVSLDEIGKTLFKTKEEAEANLPQPPKGE